MAVVLRFDPSLRCRWCCDRLRPAQRQEFAKELPKVKDDSRADGLRRWLDHHKGNWWAYGMGGDNYSIPISVDDLPLVWLVICDQCGKVYLDPIEKSPI